MITFPFLLSFKLDKQTVDINDISEERNIDFDDGAAIDHLVLYNIATNGSSWKTSNFKKLLRFEVVFFFQALIVLILIVISLFKMMFFDTPSDDMSFCVSLLSGAFGCILPNPHL